MQPLTKQIVKKMVPLPFVICLLFFLPAGTFDFWQVYVFWGVVLVPMFAAMVYFLKNDPAVIERRFKTQEKAEEQRVIIKILAASVVAVYLIPGFDKRFGWSEISVEIVLAADALVLIGYVFMIYVFKVNAFAARTIEVEDNQIVIDSGPYGVVRHPMYVGAFLMYLGTPVALGSWWGLLPVTIIPALLAARLLHEEKVLREELKGYSEYCERVRWRLLPWIW